MGRNSTSREPWEEPGGYETAWPETALQTAWQEATLPRDDCELSWREKGQGEALLFLHGGPGLDHHLLHPLAEPLVDGFRCVLFDQRGCGLSRLRHAPTAIEAALQVELMVEDIEALRLHLGLEQWTLVGWSFGASLALLYDLLYPGRVARSVLIAPGPLNGETEAVYRANRLRPLSPLERAEYGTLISQSRVAQAAGDRTAFNSLFPDLTKFTFRSWFYSPEIAAEQLPIFLQTVADPYETAIINAHVSASAARLALWSRMEHLDTPALIVYGYQDVEPVTQAYLLQQRMPRAKLCLLNECGHWPWLEQPALFFAALREFLTT